MQVLKSIFAKLIQTPLIGNEEKESLIKSFNALTNEDAMLKMCKQIEYSYCTDEFLNEINIKDTMHTSLQTPQKRTTTPIEFTIINNDVNGNPRYVVHFLDLLTSEEQAGLSISERYQLAVKKANKIGGKKYNTKKYGGGIVFQSYNLPDLERNINEIK